MKFTRYLLGLLTTTLLVEASHLQIIPNMLFKVQITQRYCNGCKTSMRHCVKICVVDPASVYIVALFIYK
jgi:hypothetical protein